MKLRYPTLVSIAALTALPACGAGLSGSPTSAIAPDSVTLPAPDRGSSGGQRERDPLVCDRKLDDFSSGRAGEFPEGWETWRDADLEQARRDRAFTLVREDDRALLRVTAATRELSIGRSVKAWDFRVYPILEWRWRVLGAPAAPVHANDAPLARVGAVWLTGFPFVVRRIDYTWNAVRPLATQESSRFGQDRSIVVASAENAIGDWHTVRVDVRRHYASIFSSEDPDAPAGIAITAQESSSGAQATVDYRDFSLCRHAAPEEDHP